MARRKEVQIKRDIEEMQSKKEAQEEYVMSERMREVHRDRESEGMYAEIIKCCDKCRRRAREREKVLEVREER